MTAENDKLTGYGELTAILLNLPLLVREKRRRLGLSLRDVAKVSDVAFSTVSRCESGYDMRLSSVLELLAWVGAPDSPPSPSPERNTQ
jgi:hypothetical protein